MAATLTAALGRRFSIPDHRGHRRVLGGTFFEVLRYRGPSDV